MKKQKQIVFHYEREFKSINLFKMKCNAILESDGCGCHIAI